MNQSIHFPRFLLVWCCVAVAVARFANCASGQSSQAHDNAESLLRDIDTAWSQRTKAVTSVTMAGTIEKVYTGSDDGAQADSGPFSGPPREKNRLYTLTVNYAYEQGKISFTRSAEVAQRNRPHQVGQQRIRRAFDGHVNALLFEETAMPMPLGELERRKTAGRDNYVNSDLLAIGLWLYPKEVLRLTEWLPSDMSVEEGIIEVNGVKCRRLRVARRGSGRWTSAIDVAIDNSWVPMQWQTWIGETLTLTLRMDYMNVEKVGPVASGWNYIYYEAKGKTELLPAGSR